MNDLPSYPTPRQAAYVVPSNSSNSSGRKKPQGYSNVSYKPANLSQYLSQPMHQSQSRQQPVQQVHYQQPQSNGYYQQSAPQQHHSQHHQHQHPPPPPPPQQYQSSSHGYYSQPNNLSAAPTPQQAYYQPQQAPQAPQSQSIPQPIQQTYQQQHRPPPPNDNYQPNNSQRIRKPSPPSSYHKPIEPPKQTAKQKLEQELRAVFDKVDSSGSGRISKVELSNALLNFDHTKFQESTIILMINLFTSPNSNSKHLNFEQFVSLWKYLSAYKKLFIQADTNNSGDISFGEFQKILEQIGYKLNIDLVLHLFQRFSYKDHSSLDSTAVGKLKFDKFIELLVYLRKLTDIFKKYDKDLSGVATINFLDFLFEVSNLN